MSGCAYRFGRAAPEEAGLVYGLLLQRIGWMEENGIRQWDREVYLDLYPLSYFQQQAGEGRIYTLRRGKGALCAFSVLLEEDPRWPDTGEVPALYVHNLASAPDSPGAGTALLREYMRLAGARGARYLRLDCARDNPVLNDYYERLGFQYVAPVEEGGYLGYLRQYPLERSSHETAMRQEAEGKKG